VVPKGLFTAGFLARLLHEKYVLGRPVHRVVSALAAEGLEVAPGTLAGELRQVAPLLAPWAQAIAAHGRQAGHAHCDETSWQVFEDVADKENHRWWLWVFVTPDTTVFVMDPSRSARVAAGQLGIDLDQTALEAGRRLVISSDFHRAYQSLARIDGVDALYGESHVLHGVSFALGEGRVLALLGRNGAGKTTCMNSVIGFLPPRKGAIRLFGEPVARLAPDVISRKGIGLVPQGRRVFPRLSVQENLAVAHQKRKGTWNLERVFALFPRLRERAQQDAGSLSGGEQQMLAIARALMGNPKVLLMDEPSEGLAPLIVAEVGRTIARLKSEGQSIVLVEQNVKLAFSLADDVVILNTGRVAFAGPVEAVRDNEALITQHLGVF
jgi:branched-chain amino acid transport system ATP-binding protein